MMEPKSELHPALEAEIDRLSTEVVSRRREGVGEREIIKESLKTRAEGAGEAKPSVEPAEPTVLPNYAAEESPETRLYVESIIDKFWHDGDMLSAVAEAKKGGPLALDLFHDALAGKFHDVMKQRGLL